MLAEVFASLARAGLRFWRGLVRAGSVLWVLAVIGCGTSPVEPEPDTEEVLFCHPPVPGGKVPEECK